MATIVDTPRDQAFRPELADEVGTGTRTPGWDRGTERRLDDGETLARGMGWFSFALGATEVLFAERIAEWLGVDEHAGLIRLFGFREIATGVGIFSRRAPAEWIYGRLAGDALDLAALGAAFAGGARKGNVLAAIGAVAGATALDALCARQLADNPRA